MIARIAIDYEGREAQKKAIESPEGLAILRDIWGSAAPDPAQEKEPYAWNNDILIYMETDGPRLAALGIPFTVKNFKGVRPLEALLPPDPLTHTGPVTYTTYVQIPHIGLLAIDEVMVEEDCCTDCLQMKINEGWRILCVCPPNAARRPDYILGRTKERS